MAKVSIEQTGAFEIEFKIIGPTGKVVETKTVTGKGDTEAVAFADARAQIDKVLKEDHTVSFTGKFKKL